MRRWKTCLCWLLAVTALFVPLLPSDAAPALIVHTSASDFGQGAGDGGVLVTNVRGGELTLASRGLGIAPWNELTATPLPRALQEHTAAIINNYLFVIGGESSAGYEQAVLRARVEPDGSLGSWQEMPALPQPILRHAMVTAGSTLFVVGGARSRDPNIPLGTIYRASVVADGSLGGWTELADTPLPQALAHLTAAVVSGYLFVMGGEAVNSPPQATVYRAPIRADGTLGAWTTTTPLPLPLINHAVATAGNCLFLTGGESGTGVRRSEVYSALIGVDGRLDTWRRLDNARLPRPLTAHTISVLAGQLIVAAGNTDSPDFDRDEVYRAAVKENCTLEPWQELTGAALPARMMDHAAAASDQFLFIVGGDSTFQRRATVYRTAVVRDRDLGGWQAAGQTPLPQALAGHAAALAQESLFITGGQTAGVVQSAVYRTPAPVDGRIGAWTAATPLPKPLYQHVTLVAGNRLLTIGGNDGNTDQAAMYEAPIDSGGILGAWRTHPCTLPMALSGHAAVMAGDYIYLSGGRLGFEDTAGELGMSVLLSNRPYPPTPGPCNFTEIGWSDLAYRLRRHATQF